MHSALKADKRSAGLTSALLTRALAVCLRLLFCFRGKFVSGAVLDMGEPRIASSDGCSHVGIAWRVLWVLMIVHVEG